jgi:erythrocyte band 7 integral membrane protein
VRQLSIFSLNKFCQVIAAEGEKKASGALRDASEIISESSSALQLRYLQVLQQGVF